MVNHGKRMLNSKLILNLFDEQITTCFFLDGYHGINQIRVKTINYIEQTYILIVEILVMNYNFVFCHIRNFPLFSQINLILCPLLFLHKPHFIFYGLISTWSEKQKLKGF